MFPVSSRPDSNAFSYRHTLESDFPSPKRGGYPRDDDLATLFPEFAGNFKGVVVTKDGGLGS